MCRGMIVDGFRGGVVHRKFAGKDEVNILPLLSHNELQAVVVELAKGKSPPTRV